MHTPHATSQADRGSLWARWIGRRRPARKTSNDRLESAQATTNRRTLRLYRARWQMHLAASTSTCRDLRGSTLDEGCAIPRGVAFGLRLRPGVPTGAVLSLSPAIASALGLRLGQVLLERQPGTDPDALSLRLVLDPPSPMPIRNFEGGVVLGPYADGIEHATWRLYDDTSMWGGLVTGDTRSDPDSLLEQIALTAHSRGDTYVIHVDPREGETCPTLWAHARESYGLDDVPALLERLAVIGRRRRFRVDADGHTSLSADHPGILVVVTRPHRVFTRELADRWWQVFRPARKTRMALVTADGEGTLATFNSTALRGLLAGGNHVVLRSSARHVYAPGAPVPPANLELGYGLTLGPAAARHAPFRLPTLPSAITPPAQLVSLPDELLQLPDSSRPHPSDTDMDHELDLAGGIDLAAALTAAEPPLISAPTQSDLLDLHRQLSARAAEHYMFVAAAKSVAALSGLLVDFPGADPGTATQVATSIIAGLRRPRDLRPHEEASRFDVARAHLDTLRMQKRLQAASKPPTA